MRVRRLRQHDCHAPARFADGCRLSRAVVISGGLLNRFNRWFRLSDLANRLRKVGPFRWPLIPARSALSARNYCAVAVCSRVPRSAPLWTESSSQFAGERKKAPPRRGLRSVRRAGEGGLLAARTPTTSNRRGDSWSRLRRSCFGHRCLLALTFGVDAVLLDALVTR